MGPHLQGFVEQDGFGELLGGNESIGFCGLLLPVLLEGQQATSWQPFEAHVTQKDDQHLHIGDVLLHVMKVLQVLNTKPQPFCFNMIGSARDYGLLSCIGMSAAQQHLQNDQRRGLQTA